jgi:asparagine synthetase B (glutamine-hydrolysing)
MMPIRVLAKLDPSFAWDGARLYREAELAETVPSGLRGAASFAGPTRGDGQPGGWRIVRDPLGINKLFWARAEDGTVAVATRPRQLVDDGHPLEALRAVPRGCVSDFHASASEPLQSSLIPDSWSATPSRANLELVGQQIREMLDRYLDAIATTNAFSRAFVCLSGGLDSSGIALLVREHFPDAVAVSFDLDRGGARSEDRVTAARLARDFGMPLLEATVRPDVLLDHLDTVLVEGIDWRDFNVHAGLVNAVLAAAVAEAASDSASVVFTGDLANEFLVDYEPERYRGATYYRLPRLNPVALRRSLVRGLDSCHREVGVFGAWHLPLIQPYAIAVDAYLSLPEEFLQLPDRKERLCRAVFGDGLPAYVYSRPKTRAQVGGAEAGGGVLAVCIDHGVDAEHLRRRFAELHGVGDPGLLDRLLRAGGYRASYPSLPSDDDRA